MSDPSTDNVSPPAARSTPRPALPPDVAADAARDPIASVALTRSPSTGERVAPGAPTNRLAMLSETVLPALFLGGLVYASWMIIAPFLAALTWAVMVAYATYPLYERLRALLGDRSRLAAAIMSLTSAVVLFAPLVWGAVAVQQEAGVLAAATRKFLADPPAIPQWIARLPAIGEWLAHVRADWLSRPEILTAEIGDWLRARTGDMAAIAGQIGKNFGKMVIALVTMFFVYRDWEYIVAQVRNVFARFLGDRVDDYLIAIGTTTRAVVYGLLITAFVQGALAGASYAIAGAPAPVLLGLITAVLALIPFATPLAWGSVAIWLLSQGETAAGIGVIIWGAAVVSQIDNVIRPIVISAQTDVPFLVVLIGVLGGVVAFGLIGLFIGPIVLAVLLAVWREWAEDEAEAAEGSGASRE